MINKPEIHFDAYGVVNIFFATEEAMELARRLRHRHELLDEFNLWLLDGDEGEWEGYEGSFSINFSKVGWADLLGEKHVGIGITFSIYARGDIADPLDRLDYTKEPKDLGLDDWLPIASFMRKLLALPPHNEEEDFESTIEMAEGEAL